ncbi:MAG: hypothetical protein A2808_03300 [Candidatus Moranbacteria bacterium RIFCSPHIGHO2_01_FULL_55_24]|nr:MAG: hypothetical protein A2808_03300 [Candidatus Moranbacteria bacterium RIFCSPHIGHO2_01_FULL_55_24]
MVESLNFISEKGSALDIGAGTLNDVKRLLAEGFQEVVAIDSAKEFPALAEQIKDPRFSYRFGGTESYDFPTEHFDLVSSQFTLPFLRKEDFPKVWKGIRESLKPGAIFCGQLFGDRDEWNTPETKMTFFTKQETEDLLGSYEVIKFEEIEKDGSTAVGTTKHWHFFNFLVKKKK